MQNKKNTKLIINVYKRIVIINKPEIGTRFPFSDIITI